MTLYTNALLWIEGEWTKKPASILVIDSIIKEIFQNEIPNLPNTEKIDLCNAYLYPGFTDTHTHSFEGGFYSLGLDLSTAKSVNDILQMINAASQNEPETLFAWQLDETLLAEKRFPTVSELDKAQPKRPLVLRRIDGHSCVLNSAARKLLSIDTQNEILRGNLNDQAVHFFHSRINPETILAAYDAAAQIALKGGFTGLHTMVGDAADSIGHYRFLSHNLNRFPITWTLYPQSFNLKDALDAGATRIGGCILADGSIGSQTAALSKPYQNSTSLGTLYHTNQFWQDFIDKASAHGLQVAVHCIGDRAIKQINDAYLKQSRTRELRHQLIHCELTDNALISEISLSGAAAVMQPNFDLLWGGDDGFYARSLGLERSRQMNRTKTMTDNGIKVCGGSDWYITELNAAKSIMAAMQHHNPLERLSHAQAVDLYTTNAAWLSNEEAFRGKIAPGYQADFCVFSKPLDSKDAQPVLQKTICKGVIRYEA